MTELKDVHHVPGQLCPVCGYYANACGMLDGESTPPSPGDVVMCLACGAWLVMTPTLHEEVLTPEAFAQLEPETITALLKMRRAWSTLPEYARRAMRQRGGRA
jgi:hypothetical protein